MHHMSKRPPPPNRVICGDAVEVLPGLPAASVQLIYVDPPFNTGKIQERRTVTTAQAPDGAHRGFGGRRYRTTEVSRLGYVDAHDDYVAFIAPLMAEAHRLLRPDGTLYFHIDPREAHYCKVALDSVFGRRNFMNEIIWAYDYGGRPRNRWPQKHDTILVYAKKLGDHYFDQDAIDRIPYMAPSLVTPEKRERGKLPTDVWWHTIVPTTGSEKTGYPNQKPEGILQRIISASSAPDEMVLDFFAGSGTTGAVAQRLGRRFTLIDRNPAAIAIMRARLGEAHIAYS